MDDQVIPELVGGTLAGAMAIVLIFISAFVVFYLCKRQREKNGISSGENLCMRSLLRATIITVEWLL